MQNALTGIVPHHFSCGTIFFSCFLLHLLVGLAVCLAKCACHHGFVKLLKQKQKGRYDVLISS
ncbi:hypothetical protein PthstB1num2_05950 [Parageobacillus thermoglucosidasius]|nr:hypothetical protein PthstB1num2_05950 [Parageobacillus thermoglucosidasius]